MLSALLAVHLLTAGLAAEEAPASPLQKASQAIQSKDYRKAAQFYEEALKSDPNNGKIHLYLGLTYGNLGQFEPALTHAKKAVDLEPGYQSYRNLALLYANKGSIPQAKEAYEKALKDSPSSFQAWYELGLLNAGVGDFTEAVAAYEKAVRLNSQFAEAYLGLGAAYYQLGDKASAYKQVGSLKLMGLSARALQLETWIKNKESRRNPSAAPAEAPIAETPNNPAPSGS